MAFRIKAHESLLDGLRRIAHEQIDKAIGAIETEKLDLAEKVHDLRKRCKKLRGLVRLARPGLQSYQKENTWFRDTARMFSEPRDARTMLDAYDSLMGYYEEQVNRPTFGTIRRELTEHRKALLDRLDIAEQLRVARERFLRARDRTATWSLAADSDAAICGGAARTYGRARKALTKAMQDLSPSAFHEARKRVKYHWYHCRLLREVWPALFRARQREAHRLSDLLGYDHDLAVLASRVNACPSAFADDETVRAFSGCSINGAKS